MLDQYDLSKLTISKLDLWFKSHFPTNRYFMLEIEIEIAQEHNDNVYLDKLNKLKLQWLLEGPDG